MYDIPYERPYICLYSDIKIKPLHTPYQRGVCSEHFISKRGKFALTRRGKFAHGEHAPQMWRTSPRLLNLTQTLSLLIYTLHYMIIMIMFNNM